MNTRDYMDYIVDTSVDSIELAEEIGEVFDKLCWITMDNGSEIQRVRETWLKSQDYARIKISLNMNSIYPFLNRVEMEDVFQRIMNLYSDLSELCNKLIEERKKLNEPLDN